MKTRSCRIALALAVALFGAAPLVNGADALPTGSGNPAPADKPATIVASSAQVQESPGAEVAGPTAGESPTDNGRKHSNSPHPADLSYKRPVYPIGVPNPPVSLESY
jgi:hypothetical protein